MTKKEEIYNKIVEKTYRIIGDVTADGDEEYDEDFGFTRAQIAYMHVLIAAISEVIAEETAPKH